VRFRSAIYKVNLTVFVISFVVLGWLAMQPATPTLTLMSQIFSFLYFAFFVVLFVTSKNESTKPVPDRVTS
jgi:ubiquinol-cytochrome c reductase cytochrome b subunit